MGSHEKLIQKAIGQIAQKIGIDTPKKEKPSQRELLAAALRTYRRAIQPPHNDDDDEASPVIRSEDVVSVLVGLGVRKKTAAKLARPISRQVNAFDGSD